MIKNIFSNWASFAISVVVGFLLSPFLVHSLGDSAYGLWVLVLSVTGYMGLLDTGLRVSIVKHTAESNARGDTVGLNRVLFTGLALYVGLGVLVVLLAAGASPWFHIWFKLPASEAATGRLLALLAGINIALSLPLGVLGGLLAGLQRYDRVSQATVIVLLVRTAAIVAAVLAGFGLIALAWIHIASQVLTGVIMIAMARREFPALDMTPQSLHWPTVRSLYSYSGFIILNNVAMFLLFFSGEVLIGLFLGAAAVTVFAIARSLVQYLSTLIGAMTQVFHPYASDQHERGNTRAVADALIVGTKTTLLIALPVGASFVIIGRTFIGLWMGPQYADPAGSLLTMLTVSQIVWLSQSTAGNILLGIDRHRFLTALNMATGVIGIAAGALLIRSFGAWGVPAGMAVPIIVTQAFILPIVTARTLRLSIAEYFTRAYLGPMVATVPFALALFLIAGRWPAEHLVTLAGEIALSLCVFLPCAYFVAFNKEERERWFSKLRPGKLASGVL